MSNKRGSLSDAIIKLIEHSRIKQAIFDIVAYFVETAEKATQLKYQETIFMMLDMINAPKQIEDELREIFSGDNLGGNETVSAFAENVGTQASGALMGPIMQLVNMAMNKAIRPQRFDIDTAFMLTYRDPENSKVWIEHLTDLGYSDGMMLAYNEHVKQDDDLGVLLTNMFRGKISREDVIDELNKRRFRGPAIERIMEASNFRPSTSDIISFVVRDVFSEDAIQRLGLLQDIPDEYLEQMRLNGVDDYWSEKFWGAHWSLPGIQTAFTMFHRLRPEKGGITFDEQDLELLLKAGDVAPNMRDKLLAISYNTFTRVDVRRMFSLGVLDYDGVVSAYKDLGYSPDDAVKMADYVVADVANNEKGLSRSVILNSFSDGILTESEAREELKKQGLTQQYIDFWIEYQITQDELKEDKDKADLEIDRFVDGDISEVELTAALDKIAKTTQQREKYLSEARLKKQKSFKPLSLSQIEDLFIVDQITQDDIVKYVSKVGYREDESKMLSMLIASRAIAEKEKDKERAEKKLLSEQNKVIKDTYSLAVSELDLAKRKIDLDIADIKLSVLDENSGIDKETGKRQIAELKKEIASINLQKEQLRDELIRNLQS